MEVVTLAGEIRNYTTTHGESPPPPSTIYARGDWCSGGMKNSLRRQSEERVLSTLPCAGNTLLLDAGLSFCGFTTVLKFKMYTRCRCNLYSSALCCGECERARVCTQEISHQARYSKFPELIYTHTCIRTWS
jgi:hypothetical protein